MQTLLIQSAIIGIFATSLMTGFLYLAAAIIRERLQVIQVLGTMLTNQTTNNNGLSSNLNALLTGTVVHYMVGFVFALVYILLYRNGLNDFSLTHTLIFGLYIGILAIFVWWLFIILHPHPPRINLKYYLPSIFLSHLVFGFGIHCCYYLF